MTKGICLLKPVAKLAPALCILALGGCGGSSDSSGGAVTGPAAAQASTLSTSSRISGNNAPGISGLPMKEIALGNSYEFKPVASDIDGDSLTFRISGKPSWANFNSGNGRLSGKPTKDDLGIAPNIRIIVSDGKTTRSLPLFDITVVNELSPNTAPKISGKPKQSVTAGENYFFNPQSSDADKDELAFQAVNLPDWARIDRKSGKIFGAPSNADVGLYQDIRIKVSDGIALSRLPAFNIRVLPGAEPNSAPVITGVPASSATAGSLYSFVPQAKDRENDSLTFSISNKPDWARFNQNTGQLTGTPDQTNIGTEWGIKIAVSDGVSKSTLEPFSITVKKAVTSTASKYNPGHYISMKRFDDRTDKLEALRQPGVQGLQIRYYWNELETSFDKYSLNRLQADLDLVASKGKTLVIIVEDKTFNGDIPTPHYLRNEYTYPNRNGGYTAIRWNPYVVERFTKLLRIVGNKFDDHPGLEGIAIQESSLSLNDSVLKAANYSPEKYRDSIIETLQKASRHFPQSQVFWYMNFLTKNQGYLDVIARTVAPLGVIMGGPDVLPDSQELWNHAYPLYPKYKGKMKLFNSLQFDSYSHRHADTSYPTPYWTMKEMFFFARDELHVNYLFWNHKKARIPQNSYSWLDALPVIAQYSEFN